MDKQRFAEAYELNEQIGNIKTFLDFISQYNSTISLVATYDNSSCHISQLDQDISNLIAEELSKKVEELEEEFEKI